MKTKDLVFICPSCNIKLFKLNENLVNGERIRINYMVFFEKEYVAHEKAICHKCGYNFSYDMHNVEKYIKEEK